MPASSQQQETDVALMFEGTVPSKVCVLAVRDARDFVKCEGIQTSNDNYDLFLRYYAAHLLYMMGYASRITSSSVAEVSTTFKDLELGDKEGMSPYLLLFQALNPASKFIIDV